jgi:transcriptional regulator with XRE-family HTH domain
MTKKEMIAFGLRIWAVRMSRNISLRELSDRTNISHGQLWNVENGKSLPSLLAYFAICRELKLGQPPLT